ncbi:hypothetical protein BsIDN1_24150 [Bacillus safensis]|uniref:Methylguanine DNA methyltransferase ribonuclease-like domain-containing protein n=1 Tax=Bacillus safensis TaxID=561879 RepID=A0A5S9M5K8_BACIA|nr:hypothetical protein BsIDN1_24150 [Bacillus safensis]
MYYTVYHAPIGELYILEKDGAIIEVMFDDEPFLKKKAGSESKASRYACLTRSEKAAR